LLHPEHAELRLRHRRVEPVVAALFRIQLFRIGADDLFIESPAKSWRPA